MNISFEEITRFLWVVPGTKDLENATPISASELSAGERILARGRSAGDPALLATTSIIVLNRAISPRNMRPSARSGKNKASVV
jgi:hypothetical protein